MENRRRNIKKDLDRKISGIVNSFKVNEPLKNHTTYRIGGPAEFFIEAQSVKEISEVCLLASKEKIPLLVLGGGSNILVSDKGFKGIVVKLTGEFKNFSFEGSELETGCGVNSSVLLKAAAERGFSGLECLAGVPGTIGGAIIGNSGSGKSWIGEIVHLVQVINTKAKIEEISKEKLKFSYRNSNLAKYILLKAKLHLKKSVKNDIFNDIQASIAKRSKAQPLGEWNAGSVFKNPPGQSAGFLIEQCGLKGLKFGGAKISEKHANFIINTGEAKATDVLELIRITRDKVKEKNNIDLELEIKIIE